MLHTMARNVAFFFVSKEIIEEEQVEVNTYGLELIFSTLLNGVLVFTFATVLGLFWQTILMLIPFMLIRSTAGGFHAKTHRGCATSFILVYIVGVLVLKFIPLEFSQPIMTLALIISFSTVLIIGIIPHKNRHLTKKEMIKFRRYARLFAGALFLAGLVGMYLRPELFIYFSLGLSISAGSLLVERIRITTAS